MKSFCFHIKMPPVFLGPDLKQSLSPLSLLPYLPVARLGNCGSGLESCWISFYCCGFAGEIVTYVFL